MTSSISLTRRGSLTALATSPLAVAASANAQPSDMFSVSGVYMNAAYTHPMPRVSAEAARRFLEGRADPQKWMMRDAIEARRLFAQLINGSIEEIAAVPSTSYAESFIINALGLTGGSGARIVTDILHFDGSLYAYGELARQGADVVTLPMTAGGRIDMNRLEAAVTAGTRLVAISAVSMVNGFEHDLKAVCDIAHRRGARVYVDAVQAAGAVPIDVRHSGVDFLAASTFKWLMGDFGYGFLYVRRDRLDELKRTQLGYHQPRTTTYHAFPGDPPGAPLFEADAPRDTAVSLFEVGSLNIAAEIAVTQSLKMLLAMDVAAIQAKRQPIIEALRAGLGRRYQPMTPADSRSGILTFYAPGAEAKLGARMRAAGVNVQLYENRIRVSPSHYNRLDQVGAVLAALGA